jgi:tRNA threonylcarbamoyladenosine biosynthesis protein TsaE
METENFKTMSEDETISLGNTFAKRLILGDVVALYGDLGSGKTEFIKGICDFFKVEEIVTSPTFTIMNQYTGIIKHNDLTIYHIDLYRIKSDKELDEIGFNECIYADDAIKLVEWAEKAENYLPGNRYSIRILTDKDIENNRLIEIEKHSNN